MSCALRNAVACICGRASSIDGVFVIRALVKDSLAPVGDPLLTHLVIEVGLLTSRIERDP